MTHIVFFTFTDPSHAAEAAQRLRSLLGVVPSLQGLEVGVDTLRTGRSWDLSLIARFADHAGLESYRVHPAHQAVVDWIKPRASKSAAVDY